MYPIVRTLKELWLNRHHAPLPIGEDHVTRLMVRPWDIDVFLELNNGRVLTLFDLGRFGMFSRIGAIKKLKENGWYGTVAGSVIRYRKRITILQRLELRTRIIGWDDKFTYIEQAFWRGDTCAAHGVVRTAITTGKGIVPTSELARVFDLPRESPPLPDWVNQWADAERARPWPPERR